MLLFLNFKNRDTYSDDNLIKIANGIGTYIVSASLFAGPTIIVSIPAYHRVRYSTFIRIIIFVWCFTSKLGFLFVCLFFFKFILARTFLSPPARSPFRGIYAQKLVSFDSFTANCFTRHGRCTISTRYFEYGRKTRGFDEIIHNLHT